MYCENCGTEENVTDTEFGKLCDGCYAILTMQHLDITTEDMNEN